MQRNIRVPRRVEVDRETVSKWLRGVGMVTVAFVLGECKMLFGGYPLGMALLCAASRDVPFIFAGLFASALSGGGGGLMLGAYLMAIALRILLRLFVDNAYLRRADIPTDPAGRTRAAALGLFGESVYLRMTVAAACAFFTGVVELVSGGFHYYDLFGALTNIALVPSAVLLLSPCLSREGREHRGYELSCLVMVAAVALSVRDLTFLGVSVAAFGGMLVTLVTGRRRGLLSACIVGFVCGVCFDLTLAPIFVIAAIGDRLIANISAVGGALCAFAAAFAWGAYMEGLSSLSLLLPGLLLATCAYLGAARVGWLSCGERELESHEAECEMVTDPRLEAALWRIADDEGQLMGLSDSLGALSRVFYDLSDKLRRPGLLDLRRICDGVMDKHCPSCPRRDACWGAEYNASLDMIGRLSSSLNERGRVTPDCLTGGMRSRCRRVEAICEDINAAAGELTAAVLKSEKIGVFALDYEAMSRLLAEAVESRRTEQICSEEQNAAVAAALDSINLRRDSHVVYGGRRKYVSVRGIAPMEEGVETGAIREALSRAVGCCLDEPMVESGADGISITLTSRPILAVASGGECLAAEEGDACGDSLCTFRTDKDIFYALISDGMGSGGEAAFCSGLVTLFLEKMLSAGNRPDTAIKMLNGVLCAKGGEREMECSATVDLLSVDLLTGEAAVLKSGAAPTFVRRGGNIFRLHSETVPLGILNAIDAQRTVLTLLPEDTVIMVSDGVSDVGEEADGEEGEGWLADLLGYEWDDDLSRMAAKIVGRARSLGSRDDVTAVLVRVDSLAAAR